MLRRNHRNGIVQLHDRRMLDHQHHAELIPCILAIAGGGGGGKTGAGAGGSPTGTGTSTTWCSTNSLTSYCNGNAGFNSGTAGGGGAGDRVGSRQVPLGTQARSSRSTHLHPSRAPRAPSSVCRSPV